MDTFYRFGIIEPAKRGDITNLLALLRSGKPIPSDAILLVAELLEAYVKEKRPRGRPKRESARKDLLTQVGAYKALELKESLMQKAPGKGKPTDSYREALEITSKEVRLSPDVIDKQIYPRGKKRKSK
jgi:hypothetical protein